MNNLKKLGLYIFKPLIILFIIFGPTGVSAQKLKLKFDHVTIEDGLSQSSVYSILEDKNGFMWFGTRTGGLNKYDGYSFSTFKHNSEDSLSISGNEIISLLEDVNGNIWVGTRSSGLNKLNYNTNKFTKYYNIFEDTNSIPDNTINNMFNDVDGNVWIVSNGGISIYQPQEDNFIRINLLKYGVFGTKVIAPSSNTNTFWIGAKSGLYLFDMYKRELIKQFSHEDNNPSSLSDSYVTSIAEDRRGRVWVGTRKGGLNRLDDPNINSFITFTHDPNDRTTISSNVIRTLHKDKNGVIWVGTKIALEQLSVKQQESQTPVFTHHVKDESDAQSMNQNSVFSFCEDSNGNFWIGTYNGGVNYLFNGAKKFEHHRHHVFDDNSLSNNVVSCFAVNDEEIWIGTEGGGLNLMNRLTGDFTHFRKDVNKPGALKSDHVKSLLLDKFGNLWVGTYTGLQLYDRTSKSFSLYLEGENIYTLSLGIDDELWIGSIARLFKLNISDMTFKKYENIEGDPFSISNNSINKIYTDSNGKVWIGTKNGLNYYNREEDDFRRFLHDARINSSLSHSHVTTICEDDSGSIWVGTYNGLNRFDFANNSFQYFGENIGIPGNVITNLLIDNKECLWLTTNSKLTRLTPEINLTKDGQISYKFIDVRNYDNGDGLQNGEFRLNSAFEGANGEMFVGGIDGFNSFFPEGVIDNKQVPRVVITEFKLFNKAVAVGDYDSILPTQLAQTKSIHLNYQQRVFSFGFVALNYTSSEKNKFAYKMEGFDDSWNYIGNKREATYTGMPAGAYVFRVKASNNDGIWNEEGVSIKVIVHPPWWATWWFRIITIFVLVAIVSGFYIYRVGMLKRQKRVLERKILERTTELHELNTELEEIHEEVVMQKESIIEQNKELEIQNHRIERAYTNVEILSEIGKNITASLAVEMIIETTYQSLIGMMNVPHFSIGIYNAEENCLIFKGTKEKGETHLDYSYNLDDKSRVAVWCFNEQEQILINDFGVEHTKYVSDLRESATGILPGSLMYLPLNVKSERIGVISVQSELKNVFTKHHQSILQNIGIYVAIALDNAKVYDKVEKQANDLEKQTISLEETNATKDKFYSILAHDLKNPLGTMLGFLELVKVNYDIYDDAKRKKSIDYAFESAQLIYKLIDNLLQWSRAQRGVMPFNAELVDLQSLIESELSLLMSTSIEKEITNELRCETNDLMIIADENMLRTIIRNLVSNAIKFSFRGGVIQVVVSNRDEDILFEIVDKGMGIPEKVIEKLFRIDLDFTREGTAREKGTGLGLALCKEFVENHNGKLWVKSIEGVGSSFFFTIPNRLT